MAAHYAPQCDYDALHDFIDSNIIFGTEILEAMRANGIKHFINTGTHWQHYRNEKYNPVDIYAATKQAFEDILKFYQEAADFKVISLHLFDNYGPHDQRPKIINLFKKIAESGELLKMSPGEQLIDIVYVDDIVDAFLMAGKYLNEGRYDLCGTYGVSSGAPIGLHKAASVFEKVLGKKLQIEWGGRPYRQREVMIPWNNFKPLPGWQPKISFEDGLKKILQHQQ